MLKIVLFALAGFSTFVSGLALAATTFKDGVINSDNVIEKRLSPRR